jgi:hypothetical protein
MKLDVGKTGRLFSQRKTVGILLFPEAMDDMNFGEMSRIRVECLHEKGNIMEIVELPTF